MNFIFNIIDLFANAKNDWRLSNAVAVQNRALRYLIVLVMIMMVLAVVAFIAEPSAAAGEMPAIQVANQFRALVSRGCLFLLAICSIGATICCLRALHAIIWADRYDK